MTTLADQIRRLHGEGRLRVWSLAVTIFGDAIAPRGGAIAMSDLSTLLELLGAESGAIRTAMSRLAGDGWVTRTKVGRRSYYALSESGLRSIRAASPRIYAAEPQEWDRVWTVALGPGAERLETDGFRRVASGTWLRPGPPPPNESNNLFLVTGTGASPDWLRATLSPPDLAARYASLAANWQDFEPTCITAPAEAMAARTLLIHDWRRVLLRDAPLPRALRPANWPGVAARDMVARHYAALAPISERWLDRCEAAAGHPLPAPTAPFHDRFAKTQQAMA
ncbi:MAG: PaaX family transcriptional regulator C-terminal domain-containing protein [Pseudomonadota bacterium]